MTLPEKGWRGYGAPKVHGEEGGREIGKLPPPCEWEIDLMKPCLMEADFSVMRRKK